MFSSPTAEISLNAPAKCIVAVQGDNCHHRFLVGTCALTASSSHHKSQIDNNSPQHNDVDHSYFSPDSTAGNNSNGNENQLYLLRYHEEMNELVVDAQLDLPRSNDDGYYGNNKNNGGEIWCLSSCPSDASLLVTCSGMTLGSRKEDAAVVNETILWRMPKEALCEDELDYYPNNENVDNVSGSDGDFMGLQYDNLPRQKPSSSSGVISSPYVTDGERQGVGFGDGKMVMEKVTSLSFPKADDDSKGRNRKGRSVLCGRVSDMNWNPECIPDVHDSNGLLSSSFDASNAVDEGFRGGSLGGPNFLTVEYGTSIVTTWDMNTSSAIPINRITVPSSSTALMTPAKSSWDPHNTNLIAVTTGLDVALLDLRSATFVGGMKSCHRFGVTDVDHNPNKPNVLSTCGQDGLVKFWDLRHYAAASSLPTSPASSFSSNDDEKSSLYRQDDDTNGGYWIKENPLRILRGGHNHWTTAVKYNSFHDQLVLSSGTDGMVNLWRISSISSAPLLDLGATGVDQDEVGRFSSYNGNYNDDDDDDVSDDLVQRRRGSDSSSAAMTDGGDAPDVRVTKMELSEAVYDIAWSAVDPWIFASLGFDGSVILNHVPSKEKYKILL